MKYMSAYRDHLPITPKWAIPTLTYVRSVSTSSQMTLRSLSASESCLGVAGGGKAESGLGEEETHSDGFISCRLRQKAATCSVLCKSKTGRKKQRSQKKVWILSNSHKSNTQISICSCYFPLSVVQESYTESEPERDSSKKKCTNLVYFQSLITMTLWLPLHLSHPSSPWCVTPTDGFAKWFITFIEISTHMSFRSIWVAVETTTDVD